MLTATSAASASYRRDLGNGLLLRWSTAEDTENIAQLCSLVFRRKADDPPNEHMQREVRLQMRGDHPLMGPGDYAVVEDTHKEGNPIVACTCLWRQDWEYEGIPFRIGRPEFVATDPSYRHRGLIRALFEIIHARSEAEGHMVTAITGIPYFYRQFGYEYALDLGGSRATPLSLIPKAKEGEPEPFTLREATIEDIPLLMALYNRRRASSVVWTNVPENYWRYHLEAWKPRPEERLFSTQMIVDASGSARGFLMVAITRWGSNLPVWALEVAGGMNLQAVMPSILRALQTYGEPLPTRRPDVGLMAGISFELGRTHPVYDVLGDALAPQHGAPYAWYVRVSDLPTFIQHIAPALERRLAGSDVAGYSGELKLNFYRGGLRVVFENGHLTTAEHWSAPIYDSNPSAGFPGLVFLQLLFGHRSIEELRHAFPDVWTDHDPEVVLKALFPARPSFVMPL